MKVLYDQQIFGLQRYGGISRYFVELVRELSASGAVEPTVLSPFYINEHLRELDQQCVSGRFVAEPPRGLRRPLRAVSWALAAHRVGRFAPDIVHETYYTDRPINQEDRQKTVITVYDMIHERFPQFFPNADRMNRLKRSALQRADHVICISETTRKDLLDLSDIDPERVSTVHLGYKATGNASTEPAPIGRPFLLYVGARGGYKNFAALLAAYRSDERLHREFQLVCFGGGPPKADEFRQLNSDGLPADSVLWMEGDDDLLSRLYRSAGAFVLPSLYEGFGIPPLEAMAQGCPVICSRGGSIPEVVGEAGEYFDPTETDDIATAIRRVVDSPARAAQLRELGLRQLESFTWRSCAERTCAIYELVLQS